jgi:hypothetical protein
MTLRFRSVLLSIFTACLVLAAVAQQAGKPGILQGSELAKLVPTTYFFADQVAPVQTRNAVALRTSDNHIVEAALVDTSGYAADVAQKYQGLFINGKKVSIEGQALPPGQYGMGFTGDGKFHILDVTSKELFSVSYHQEPQLQHAVPLKLVASGSDFRLYAGKKYVTITVQ